MHQRAVLAGMLLGDAGLDPQAFRHCLYSRRRYRREPCTAQITMSGRLT
jgi:hypothetical protein